MSARVTLFINSLRGGGAERVCATLANELHAMGWSVEILVLNLRDAVLRDSVNADIPVVDLGITHARYSALAVASYLHARHPDRFLVFNDQLAVLLVWLRCMRLGRFSVVARSISTLSRKASLEPSFWHRRVVHAMTRVFYRRVDVIIAQSEGMKRDLISNYGIDDRQLRVIHNPLSDYFTRHRSGRPVPWQSRRNEILYVGRLNTIKGLDLLMDACLICMKADPELVVRLLGDGEEMSALKRRAESAGVAHRVHFEGYVKDVLEYYAHARLLVLTSHYEGFPNVLLEAISQGTPIVSVDCESGPSEIIQEGVNGFLVKSRNARDLADALQRVLAKEWDVAGIRQTAAAFSARQVASKYSVELAGVRSRAAG